MFVVQGKTKASFEVFKTKHVIVYFIAKLSLDEGRRRCVRLSANQEPITEACVGSKTHDLTVHIISSHIKLISLCSPPVCVCLCVVLCLHAHRFRQLQLGTDSRVAELSNQAKLHSFEAQRAQMVKEETAKVLAQCQMECEKQQKKLEVPVKQSPVFS